MRSLLYRLENWLDKKNSQVNRQHSHLRYSDRPFERFMWRLFYKPPLAQRDYLTFTDKHSVESLTQGGDLAYLTHRPPSKVVHAVNYLDPLALPSGSLKNRTTLCLKSIKKANKTNVKLVGCSAEGHRGQGWTQHSLSRSSHSEFGCPKRLAFLKDMLDAACNHCKENDYIFYSNLDCPLSPDLYQNLLSQNEDIVEFFIRDVNATNLKSLFNNPYVIKRTGVDGIAIKKGVYLALRDYIPDFFIGEPHWDTTVSGIFKKFHHSVHNTQDLYHVHHERAWDTTNLSLPGKHNEILYRDAYEYGLIDDPLIILKKPSALIVLNEHASKDKKRRVEAITRSHPDHEVGFLDIIRGRQSPLKKLSDEVFYFPIWASDKTKGIPQRYPLMNIGANLFLDREMLHFMDITNYRDNKIFESLSTQEYRKKGSFNNFTLKNSNNRLVFMNDEGLLSSL